jgi:hypothetical protein
VVRSYELEPAAVCFLLLAIAFRIAASIAILSLPANTKTFEDFDLVMPAFTSFVLTEAFFLPLYLLIAFGVLKKKWIKDRNVVSFIDWFLIWTVPVYVHIFTEAMYSPWAVLRESMSMRMW